MAISKPKKTFTSPGIMPPTAPIAEDASGTPKTVGAISEVNPNRALTESTPRDTKLPSDMVSKESESALDDQIHEDSRQSAQLATAPDGSVHLEKENTDPVASPTAEKTSSAVASSVSRTRIRGLGRFVSNAPKTPVSAAAAARRASAPAGDLSSGSRSSSSKRSAEDAGLSDTLDTEHHDSGIDSEIDTSPPKRKERKKLTLELNFRKSAEDVSPTPAGEAVAGHTIESAVSSEKTSRKKQRVQKLEQSSKNATYTIDNRDHADVTMTDVDDSDEKHATDTKAPTTQDNGKVISNVNKKSRVLVTREMKRKDRIVNPEDPNDAALIAKSTKASKDIYDSDAELEEGEIGRNILHKDLFLNVRWGPYAYEKDDEEFVQTLEDDTLIPGRWERLPDGTLRDQKAKLVVKVIDEHGNKKIFRNEPPKDWNNQTAISILNKRILQQVRRNTNVRRRDLVVPYERFEREWISKNLTKEAKPRKGWTQFVREFNREFKGKEFPNVEGKRPERTKSSLTKEVDRFREEYAKGKVPDLISSKDKRKVGAARRQAVSDSKKVDDAQKRKTI